MKTRFTCFFVCGCFFGTLWAQQEASNWVFGQNAGLRFNKNGTVTTFQSAVYSREGVAAISDPLTGGVLFYTDGVNAWNRNHQLLLNGSGLQGNYSAAQSAIVLPKPGATGRYYLFTAPQLNETNPYTYSEVNMALDGGLGGIDPTVKNIDIGLRGTEKITAARHCNGRDYWVIMRHHGTEGFSVRLVDPGGVQNATLYPLGANIQDQTWNEAACLKLSPDQLTLVHPIGPVEAVPGQSSVELYRFDPASGAISGPWMTLEGFNYAYGAEFSPDNRFLYIADIFNVGTSGVWQFDLESEDPVRIAASKVAIKESPRYNYGTLQLGPNGKIYVAKEDGYDTPSSALDVIQYPQMKGAACGYTEHGQSLGSGGTLIGLPNFPSYYYFTPMALRAKRECPGNVFNFQVAGLPPNSLVQWQFGDPNSGAANTAEGSPAQHYFSGAGLFRVTAIVRSPCGSDTLQQQVTTTTPPPFEKIRDTLICQGGKAKVKGPVPQTLWNGALQGPSFEVDRAGPVVYAFQDANGCPVQDTFWVQTALAYHTREKQSLCRGDTAIVFGKPVTQAGTYSATFSAREGCDSLHTIEVFTGVDTIVIEERLSVCRGDTLSAFGLRFFGAADTVLYKQQSAGDCVEKRLLKVDLMEKPTLLTEVTAAGCNGFAGGQIKGESNTLGGVWRIGSAAWGLSPLFRHLKAGVYTLSVKDVFGCIGKTEVTVPESVPIQAFVEVDTAQLACGQYVLNATHSSRFPVRYTWNPAAGLDCANCPNIQVLTEEARDYLLEVVDSQQCKTSVVIRIGGPVNDRLYAPNVFSPDDNGQNDFFTLYGSQCVKIIRSLNIFDRWGNRMFYRENLTPGEESEGWNGRWRNKDMQPGVFTWVAVVELLNGRQVLRAGSVTIVR